MIVILGLIIVAAVVIVGAPGVLGNGGGAHALPHGFAVLGYHMTASTGTLFLYGMVVGTVAVCGLILLLAGARRTARRGRAGRRRLQQSRRETAAVSQERDDLISQREAARADPASELGNGPPRGEGQLSPDDGRWSRPHLFGRRSAPRHAPASPQTSTAQPEMLPGHPAPQVPAGASAPAE